MKMWQVIKEIWQSSERGGVQRYCFLFFSLSLPFIQGVFSVLLTIIYSAILQMSTVKDEEAKSDAVEMLLCTGKSGLYTEI